MTMAGLLPQRARSHCIRIVLTALAFLALAATFNPGAGAAESPRDTEAGYLLEYVALICIRSSYTRLDPPAPHVVKLLAGEAWVFVEKGSLGPEVYESLYALAEAAGKGIPPLAAVRGCLAWRRGEDVRRAIAAAVAHLPHTRPSQ